MSEQKKTLAEVCKDKDLPGLTSVYRYMKINPEFNRKYIDTFNSLPYSVQARAQNLSPQFYQDVKRLYDEVFSQPEIASMFGVARQTVNIHINSKLPTV